MSNFTRKLTKQAKNSNLGHSEKDLDELVNLFWDLTLRNEYKEYVCPICGKKFTGYGNNPWPVTSEGRCCDECNNNTVIPTRRFFADCGISDDKIRKHDEKLSEIAAGNIHYFVPFVQNHDFSLIEYGLCMRNNTIDYGLYNHMANLIYSSLRDFNSNLTDFEAELLMDDILLEYLLYDKSSPKFSKEKYWKEMLENYRKYYKKLSNKQYEEIFWETLESGRAKVCLSDIISQRA